MSEKKHTVFISYRRDGGFETAKYLFDSLVRDGYSVTFDIDTLRNGRFDEALLSRIDECVDFVIILNKGCFDRTTNPDFPKENDWMRRELAHALKAKKNIIPIMLRGFYGFPDNLPDDVKDIQWMNGPKYDQDYIDAFYDKLKSFMKSASAGGVNKSSVAMRGRKTGWRIGLLISLIVAIVAGSAWFVMSRNIKAEKARTEQILARAAEEKAAAEAAQEKARQEAIAAQKEQMRIEAEMKAREKAEADKREQLAKAEADRKAKIEEEERAKRLAEAKAAEQEKVRLAAEKKAREESLKEFRDAEMARVRAEAEAAKLKAQVAELKNSESIKDGAKKSVQENEKKKLEAAVVASENSFWKMMDERDQKSRNKVSDVEKLMSRDAVEKFCKQLNEGSGSIDASIKNGFSLVRKFGYQGITAARTKMLDDEKLWQCRGILLLLDGQNIQKARAKDPMVALEYATALTMWEQAQKVGEKDLIKAKELLLGSELSSAWDCLGAYYLALWVAERNPAFEHANEAKLMVGMISEYVDDKFGIKLSGAAYGQRINADNLPSQDSVKASVKLIARGEHTSIMSAKANALNEGTDNTNVVWETGGKPSVPGEEVEWRIDRGDSADGKGTCVVSGGGGAGCSESWLSTKVQGPAMIKYWYVVQTYKGYAGVTCDGKELFSFNGVSAPGAKWKFVEYGIGAGEHEIRFIYKHPGQGFTNGFNGFKIDRFEVVPCKDDPTAGTKSANGIFNWF